MKKVMKQFLTNSTRDAIIPGLEIFGPFNSDIQEINYGFKLENMQITRRKI